MTSPSPNPSAPRWNRLLLVACLVELGLLLWFWRQPPSARPAAPIAAAQNSAFDHDPYFSGHPGPWGELEYARVNIASPDEFAQAEAEAFKVTHWFFEGQTRDQVLTLFNSLGLTTEQNQLLHDSVWTNEPSGMLIVPAGNLIMSLPPEPRARLYSILAQNRRNDLQAWPYVYRQGGFADWFSNSGLSNATIALVEQVVYPRGAALCVSDAPELCARIPAATERQRLIKTLSRSSTLLMKLRVRPDADIKALTAYWSRGWHGKDIEPLLESLQQIPGGITIDIAHLLPPFARKRLNSYPAPLEPGQRAPDCYWSAWNFFRDPPEDRYFDEALWRQELQQNYQLVEQPLFGDLIFLTRPDGIPIHCAVFVADDVVFTKNGANLRQPWKLMKMEDLLARYPEDYEVRLAAFRPKTPPN